MKLEIKFETESKFFIKMPFLAPTVKNPSDQKCLRVTKKKKKKKKKNYGIEILEIQTSILNEKNVTIIILPRCLCEYLP